MHNFLISSEESTASHHSIAISIDPNEVQSLLLSSFCLQLPYDHVMTILLFTFEILLLLPRMLFEMRIKIEFVGTGCVLLT